MAVQLFKDGETIYVQPSSLKNHLAVGWSLDDPGVPPVKHPEVIYPQSIRGIESMPDDVAEKTVLEHMGITVVHPVSTPPEVVAPVVKKRGRPKKAA
jgi:hypothetical protein